MSYYIVDLKNCYFAQNKFSNDDFVFIKSLLDQHEKIIFIALDEKWMPWLLNNCIRDLNLDYNNKDVVFVVDRLTAKQENFTINFSNVLAFDSQLIKLVSWEDRVSPNEEINLDTNKFLFLMGKPYKRHRISFLYKIYKSGIIKNCEYSYKPGLPGMQSRTRQCMPELSGKDFIKFNKQIIRDLDNVPFDFGPISSHYSGLPIDTNLYKNTSFSIIGESVCAVGEPWFLSEKTWRAIVNRHMFLPLIDYDAFKYLESIDINTFQEILPIKKEQYSSDVDIIVDNTIKNIEYLLENISTHSEYIKEAVTHNYNVYKNLVNEHRNIFPKLCDDHFYSSVYCKLEYNRIQKLDDPILGNLFLAPPVGIEPTSTL